MNPMTPQPEATEARKMAERILTDYWGQTFSAQNEAQEWLTNKLTSELTTLITREKEGREKLQDAIHMLTEHHSSSVMRREHIICPVCDNGRIEKLYTHLAKGE